MAVQGGRKFLERHSRLARHMLHCRMLTHCRVVLQAGMWGLIALLWLPLPVAAQEKEKNEISAGLLSSFALPLQDLLQKKHASEWRNLLDGWSIAGAFNYPLEKSLPQASQGRGSQGERGGNNTQIAVSLRYNPISYWFVQTTYYRYLDADLQAPWHPDFSYSFGYDDWHPYTLSLVYANYGGNRLHPERSKGERLTRFEEGTVALGWKFLLPRALEEALVVHPTGSIGCNISYNVTPKYVDLASLTRKDGKQSVRLGCKYTIYTWWYVNFTLYAYPFPEQQQPWDPDFTYGFGYFDWHPGTLSIQYNNYSGNRFPWRKSSKGTGTFQDGSLTISISWSF